MHVFQPVTKSAPKYQVLIATAAEETFRLLQPLLQVVSSDTTTESGGLFRPRQRFVFQALDYQVVDTVMRSRQTDSPCALVILEVQPGNETKVEQILSALYHADSSLGVMILLGEGASLSQTTLELITQSPRLTFLEMPVVLPQVYQMLKVMLAAWQVGQNLAALENSKNEPAAAAEHDSAADPATEAPTMHLEVMGSLASGIAHEFNNVLTVIQNQMDMAVKQAEDLPSVVDLLRQVMDTAKNASALSRKLVSFSPEESGTPAALDLQAAVDEEVMLLGKTLGEHIRLEVHHAPELPPVWADPQTVSQLIINVALHARNSMKEGGVLQISSTTAKHQTGSKLARLFPDASHGDYVMLTIEDPNPAEDIEGGDPTKVVVTLPAAVQRAANDRLAWIQKTLQELKGGFNVTLLPGMIRSYQMLFPLAQQPVSPAAEPAPDASPAVAVEGAEPLTVVPSTVLVVDDDDTICMIMRQVLATEKHRVIVAKSADEAWQQWCQNRSSIKLLITDINMPGGANGVALGHAIQEQDGSVPVIYTSGHRAVHQFAELEVGTNYLPKPFGMSDLLKVTHRALAAHGNHGLS